MKPSELLRAAANFHLAKVFTAYDALAGCLASDSDDYFAAVEFLDGAVEEVTGDPYANMDSVAAKSPELVRDIWSESIVAAEALEE